MFGYFALFAYSFGVELVWLTIGTMATATITPNFSDNKPSVVEEEPRLEVTCDTEPGDLWVIVITLQFDWHMSRHDQSHVTPAYFTLHTITTFQIYLHII